MSFRCDGCGVAHVMREKFEGGSRVLEPCRPKRTVVATRKVAYVFFSHHGEDRTETRPLHMVRATHDYKVGVEVAREQMLCDRCAAAAEVVDLTPQLEGVAGALAGEG